MKKSILFISTFFLVCSLHAEDIFKNHGFNKETLTLSKGKYEEVFTNDEVVQVGSVLLNTKTNKIVRFLDEETETSSFKAEHSSRWLTPDPLAEKYYSISPYAFALNNPVRYIDPDGREVKGLTRDDAQRLQQDFQSMFSGEEFDNFRNLITLDKKGKTFNSISSDAIAGAFDGVTLSTDQQALVNEFVGVVNSKDVHKVEYASVDGTISTAGTSAFRNQMNSNNPGVGDQMAPATNMPGSTMNALSGGGINIPTKKGSHSVIMTGAGVNHDGGRALTTGHEVIGHGPASASGASYDANNTRAIRVDNLIRRVMGLTPYPHKSHGGVIIVNPNALP